MSGTITLTKSALASAPQQQQQHQAQQHITLVQSASLSALSLSPPRQLKSALKRSRSAVMSPNKVQFSSIEGRSGKDSIRVYSPDEPAVLVNEQCRKRLLANAVLNGSVERAVGLAKKQQIALEGTLFCYPNVTGTIIVANTAFEKNVQVRMTTSQWRSHIDIPATFIGKVTDPCASSADLDRFEFTYNLSSVFRTGTRMSLCAYVLFGAECASAPPSTGIWDNNDGRNYGATMHEFAEVPSSMSGILTGDDEDDEEEAQTATNTAQSGEVAPSITASEFASLFNTSSSSTSLKTTSTGAASSPVDKPTPSWPSWLPSPPSSSPSSSPSLTLGTRSLTLEDLSPIPNSNAAINSLYRAWLDRRNVNMNAYTTIFS